MVDVQCWMLDDSILKLDAIAYSCRMQKVLWGLVLLPLISASSLFADDWPQWLGPKRDSIWRETGIVDKFPAEGPPARWRVNIGPGYSGPVVAHGRVYLTDRSLAEPASSSADPFQRAASTGGERVLCLNE